MEDLRKEYTKVGFEVGLLSMLKILNRDPELKELIEKKKPWIEKELIKERTHML